MSWNLPYVEAQSPNRDGAKTMEVGANDWSTRVLSRVPAIPRNRKKDALRRFFSIPASPRAKADISKHFKALRRKAGLTQLHLGRIIGICRQTVSEIENCRVWPHYTTLDRFCNLKRDTSRPSLCVFCV